jgi:Pyridoxamine 5'-phosphate oxidase
MPDRGEQPVGWHRLELDAPELASLGRERLAGTRLALLGSLRRDGAPRISPVEPYFAKDELVFGALVWSLKALDLARDPRCVLHSVVTGPDNGEGELKLYGRAEAADDEARLSCAEAWWNAGTSHEASVFVMRIDRAAYVEWDAETNDMVVRRWSVRHGYSHTRRKYP